jgi:hypothetical protein
MIESVT